MVDNGLRVTLYGGKGDGVFAITVSGLKLHTNYAFHGAAAGHILSDENGYARFTITLKGRTVLRLQPE
ncbi:MAG: hypothetical protein WDN06_01200 [Asticcacaulis sp.]